MSLIREGRQSVQQQRLLRDAEGKKAVDPITGEGRVLDHVVVKDGVGIDTVETTSTTANKAAQIIKEQRIREAGGTFVRDKNTRELVPVPPSRVVRKK